MNDRRRAGLGNPTVSIVVPCRNEAGFIDDALSALLAQDYPGISEILVAEGCSQDDTRARLEAWARREPRVRLVDNPEGIVPTGLNRAIRLATGAVIVRADAHSRYAPDYVRRCIEVLQRTGAANVGGPALIAGDLPVQRAFALAAGSPLALGGARSKQAGYEGPVDTVQYGCWWRDNLLDLGLFDEAFVRNQDDELNFRIRRRGGLIWQSTAIRSWLTARPTLGRVFRQYWQYGYWKVLVIAKHGAPASMRHLVPALAIVAGLLLMLLSPVFPGLWLVMAMLAVAYGVLVAAEAVRLCWRKERRLFGHVLLLIPAIHLAYGLGFLAATVERLLGVRQPGAASTRLTR